MSDADKSKQDGRDEKAKKVFEDRRRSQGKPELPEAEAKRIGDLGMLKRILLDARFWVALALFLVLLYLIVR